MLWQLDVLLVRTRQFAGFVNLCDIDGRMVCISCSVIVLIAADARDENLIVELIESPLVDVAADACIAAELQTAVVLDIVLHEKSIVIGIIAAEWIDGCCHIEFFPHGEQGLAVHRCF